MTNPASTDPQPAAPPKEPPAALPLLNKIRNRLVEGLLVVTPVLITFWIVYWLYSVLEKYVIDPLAVLVLWKIRRVNSAPELPYWFETYAAPIIALGIALVGLYYCGVFADSWLRRSVDRFLLRVPIVSSIYDGLRNMVQSFEKPGPQSTPQRVVLVEFPHPGMRLPAIVTSACRDVATDKSLLCVYVPTTPIPTSGFFLIVPEENVTELNWGVQQTLQAIISGGLTAPRTITYYSEKLAAAMASKPPPSDTNAHTPAAAEVEGPLTAAGDPGRPSESKP
jgi:uncharacterized membrane protein